METVWAQNRQKALKAPVSKLAYFNYTPKAGSGIDGT
jgi:hypothetical protein